MVRQAAARGQGDAAAPGRLLLQLEPSEALTFWIALDEVDEENGCIRYLPGSHLQGYRPHAMSNVMGFSRGVTDYGDADRAAEHAIVASPGDLVIHHCMIVHRADPNPSDRWRRALGMSTTRAAPESPSSRRRTWTS